MTSYAKIQERCDSNHHYCGSLLFQFILSDFIALFFEMQSLEILCHKKAAPEAVEQNYPDYSPEHIQKIEKQLERLIGTKNDYTKRFSSSIHEGALTRFKMHCTTFCQQAVSDEKELLAMQHYADKAWHNCMLAFDALKEAPNKCTRLFTHLEKASNYLPRLAKLIARITHQFRDDENVIFFILRHGESFDKAFGKRFVIKLFCRMYPKGLREAEHFLIRKYMDRNFDNVLPTITRLFAELELSIL